MHSNMENMNVNRRDGELERKVHKTYIVEMKKTDSFLLWKAKGKTNRRPVFHGKQNIIQQAQGMCCQAGLFSKSCGTMPCSFHGRGDR